MREGNLHILLVDDDSAVRDSICFELGLEGLKVETFASGKDLLNSVPRADCLVLDWQMPDMDGLTVKAELTRRRIDIPTILITAPLTRQIARAAQQAGCAAVLEKPLTGGVLLESIRRIS